MKKCLKILLIGLAIQVSILIFSNAESKAAELWWPIGSNDNDDKTYYVDDNGNKIENIEINSYNDKKYIKMAVGIDNETQVEYEWNRRNYRVNNYTDPYEKYYYANNEHHYGIDIRSSVKVNNNIQSVTNYHNIIAINDGKVIGTSADRMTYAGISFSDSVRRHSNNNGGGYGNYVLIETKINNKETGNEETVIILYAHMYKDSILVSKGDTVKKGQVIGKMGSSGDSGHPHLHIEIRKQGYGLAYPNANRSNLKIASTLNTYNPLIYLNKDNQRDGYVDSSEENKEEYVKGDVDGNGIIDTQDAYLVLYYVVGYKELDEKQFKAADIDNNGKVDSSDAFYILKNSVDRN